MGVSHGLRANYEWLVHKSWHEALRDATTARRLHSRVVELNPKFLDAYLVLGIHNYLIGSLPWRYRAVGFLAGIRGDRETGIKQLETVAREGDLNRYDAQVFLAAIDRREHRPQDAIPIVQGLIERFPRNYLFRLELALMYQDAGENEKALAELDDVERAKLADASAFRSLPVEKVQFYKGTVLFWANEPDRALLENFEAPCRRPAWT